jgi:hypothetical protein
VVHVDDRVAVEGRLGRRLVTGEIEVVLPRVAKLKASMAELEEEPVDHARAIARLEAGLVEIFDAPASQLIAETAAQLRSPGETGWRESLQSLIAVGVPETLHRGTRPELFGLLLSRALRDMIRAEIGRSAEGINDPRRAKTREDLAARLDAGEREEELAIRECELASLEELGPVEPGIIFTIAPIITMLKTRGFFSSSLAILPALIPSGEGHRR